MELAYPISLIVNRIKQINGVTAIVLGGSRARGSHHPASDIDIGIYYDSSVGLDIPALQQAASELDDDRRENLVTEIGGWGPWINGGGWLVVDQIPVDLLYRDLTRVSSVMEQCLSGEITIDYQPGHPHGFLNSIYFSEVALCQVLWDPSGVVKDLKERTSPYPAVLKNALIQKFFWEATFAIETGQKGIYKKDLAYMAGCCFRSIACLNQVLFAFNESFLMNEKGAAAIADSFIWVPARYSERVNRIINFLTNDQSQVEMSFQELRDLIQETSTLLNKED